MFIDKRVVTTALLMVKGTAIFSLELRNMRVSNLTRKRLKNIDILATDASKCSLLVKESLLIKRVNPVVYRATNSLPLELFD